MGISCFENVYLDDFWLCFGFPAMGIRVLEEILFLGWFLESILFLIEGHGGERFGGIVWGGFWRCRSCIPELRPT